MEVKDKRVVDLIFERLRVEFGRDDITYRKFLKSAAKYGIPKTKTYFPITKRRTRKKKEKTNVPNWLSNFAAA